MFHEPFLIMLCGLPYTGKSSAVDALLKCNNARQNTSIVSSDAYIMEAADARGVKYEDVFQYEIQNAYAKCLADFSKALCSRKNIIIDKTNVTASSRKEWLSRHYQQAKGYYTLIALVFEASECEIMQRRSLRRSHRVPLHVLRNMALSWQPPTLDEGFHYIINAKDL